MIGDLFDPKAEFFIEERMKPHWSQAGAIVFATFRTNDSIPKDVLERWDREKKDWVLRAVVKQSANEREVAGLDFSQFHWSQLLLSLPENERSKFNANFDHCRETKLDECLGACLLKNAELSEIVASSLMSFDRERYCMGDFVVMPNHVHMLVAFSSPETMKAQFASWLQYTARRINEITNSSGHFWQQEPFDHLVRSVDQYEYLRKYIEENPKKAGLRLGEYYYRRYPGQSKTA
jgi:type I restriction enzyme R subunit